MRPPLRVMQLVLSLAIGGTEKLVYDIVHRVDKRNFSPIVCCLDTYGDFGEELQREGYRVYVLNRQAGINWSLIGRLKTIIEKEKIDVIHAHQYTPYFYGLMVSLFFKITLSTKRPKLIFTEHGRFYPERRKIKRMLANPILSVFTDEIVTISESTKASLITYENFPASRIKVVYNGIDFTHFSRTCDVSAKKEALGLPSKARVIGIVARLDPIKNHAMLLRAFTQVVQTIPETYLVIVGDGPEEQSLKTLASALGISDHTIFLGARQDVAELLHVFDIFALSSFTEGTSVTLLEAMGAGIPIVATNVGGNPEVVEDQKTGYLVPNDNDQVMAAMLLKLLQDETARQKMGQAGQQRAHTWFSLDKMVNTYTNLYLKVLRRLPV
ncbi:glycosyltransferase [candidate division KSB1 bacterium]|nr:MAG: glycosyltransferase [candidate division KSB1 bacterium]